MDNYIIQVLWVKF